MNKLDITEAYLEAYMTAITAPYATRVIRKENGECEIWHIYEGINTAIRLMEDLEEDGYDIDDYVNGNMSSNKDD